MSIYIRSISNGGGRYVPSYVASVQICANVRRLSGQPPPRHGKPVFATSAFLNQFFGFNTPLDVREECALARPSKDSSSIASRQPRSLEVYSFDGINNVRRETGVNRVPYSRSRESFNEEISFTSNESSMVDSLILINKPKLQDNKIPVINERNNFINTNHRTNFSSIGTCTKEYAKVRFSNISKTSSTLKPKNTNESPTKKKGTEKQSTDDLERVYQTLSIDMPKFFVKSVDYKIYHPEIEFVNNIRGTSTRGIWNYVKQLALLRTVGHLKYAYVKLDVLKITMHTQDNTVRVRWRINGITGLRILFSFWKFKFWKIRESLKESESWHDGFSTFYVGEDGLVYKHVVDKVMPSQDAEEDKSKGIPSKLASQLSFSSLN